MYFTHRNYYHIIYLVLFIMSWQFPCSPHLFLDTSYVHSNIIENLLCRSIRNPEPNDRRQLKTIEIIDSNVASFSKLRFVHRKLVPIGSTLASVVQVQPLVYAWKECRVLLNRIR